MRHNIYPYPYYLYRAHRASIKEIILLTLAVIALLVITGLQ